MLAVLSLIPQPADDGTQIQFKSLDFSYATTIQNKVLGF